jgi:DNA-binding winged helix-turn-helix (wHTH) protein
MSAREGHIYQFERFQIDPQKRLLLRDGQPVQLTSKAFDLLLVLVKSSGQVMTKDELMSRVWQDQFVEEANLAVQVSALRRALGEKKGEQAFIVTVPGRGYSFVAAVQR